MSGSVTSARAGSGVGWAGRAAGVADWTLETVPDYRSRAHDVHVTSETGTVWMVGSADYILGPFLHFPRITSPLHDADPDDLVLAWTWDGGEPNQYTRVSR